MDLTALNRVADPVAALSNVILAAGESAGTIKKRFGAIGGAVPGIKVETGFPGETVTEGLDGLGDRLAAFHRRGARFAKWRAGIDIADGAPTAVGVKANARALARTAGLCQANDIVPIVEPEVLMDGEQRIALEGMVLKPNMVICGRKSGGRSRVKAALGRVDRKEAPAMP